MANFKSLEHGRDELQMAEAALNACASETTLVRVNKLWRDFLKHLDTAWNMMHGLKKELKGIQIKELESATNLRKRDPLLNYLKHARNAQEHDSIIEVVQGATFGFKLTSHVEISNPQFEFRVSGENPILLMENGEPYGPEEYTVDRVPQPKVILAAVLDIGGNNIETPTKHLGNEIDNDGILIGNLGLRFYINLINSLYNTTRHLSDPT